MPLIDEPSYQHLADRTFKRIEDALKDVDADDVDVERSGDVVTLTFKGNKRCVLNTQRPTRQIWLAANSRAWHFSYDSARDVWIDDKQPGVELFATVEDVVKQGAGVAIKVA
jgi:CyaY protein